MSSSAYATLALGIKINFVGESFLQKAQRFDTKNGTPFEIESEAFHIDAICPGCETKIRLPEDEELFREAKSGLFSPSLTSWNFDRFRHRTHEWLNSIGLQNENDGFDDEDQSTLGFFRPHYDGENAIVGIKLISGSSYDAESRMVSFKIPDDFPVKMMLQEKLGKLFPGGNFNPLLYLITEQS